MEQMKLSREDRDKLADVDKINEIIRNMTCSDPEVSSKAMADADKLMKKIANPPKKGLFHC